MVSFAQRETVIPDQLAMPDGGIEVVSNPDALDQRGCLPENEPPAPPRSCRGFIASSEREEERFRFVLRRAAHGAPMPYRRHGAVWVGSA